LEYYVQSTNRYDEGGGDDIHESTSFQASQQHVLSIKMAYNIEYHHDSYAWIDTTPDDYTNEGGFESSHYTTNNDTNEEGFESSSSYSSISCLSPIDAASANSLGFCCIVSEENDTRFFNTFSCILPFTKDEFDDEYTMGDESTCSSLILNDYSISEDYYDDKNESNRIGVLILNLNEDMSDRSTSSASTTTSTGDSYKHLVASRTNVGKSYDDTDKDATTVDADTITAATTVSSHVYDSYKAHQNEGDCNATDPLHNGVSDLDIEQVGAQPNAVEAFLDRMLGLTEDEELHNGVSDLDIEQVEVQTNAVEAFLVSDLDIEQVEVQISEDYYDDKNESNRIGVLILNLNEDTSDRSTSSSSTTTSTGDSYTHLVASRTNVGKSYDDTDKDATTVDADTIIAATTVSSQVYDSHKAHQNEGDVMMRSKAPKSSKRSSFSENVTLVRSSSFAVEAIAKAPQKVDAKSKSSTEKKMKSSTRTKNKTPPTRSADKSEGIWTEYIDSTIGRSYYSNGIITSWTRPNCPEMRIKHIIKNGQTNPKSLTRTKNKAPPTRSADKSEGIWTEYIDSTIGRSYYSNGIITSWTRPNCPDMRIKHIIKNGQTNPIITQMVLSLHGQGLR